MADIATSTDWWMSTRSPAGMFRPAYQNGELDAYLREHAGIDAAILAAETGLPPSHIRAFQRKLGLRKITGTARKGNAKRGARSGAPRPTVACPS